MPLPTHLPPFPEHFTEHQTDNLRTLMAGLRGVSTLKALFPAVDEPERKQFSRFIHFDGNLDYHHGRKKIAYLYENAYHRLKERRYQKVAKVLAPQIAVVFETGRTSFSDIGSTLNKAYAIDDAETRRDRQMLPGAFAFYRRTALPDGRQATMCSAMLVRATDAGLSFKLASPPWGRLFCNDGEAPALVEGVVLPHGKHLYFVGRDTSLDTPFFAMADRPSGAASVLLGLALGHDAFGLGFATRVVLLRRHRNGDPPERVFDAAMSTVGLVCDDEPEFSQLDLIDPALDNTVSPELGQYVLHQAEAATSWQRRPNDQGRRCGRIEGPRE